MDIDQIVNLVDTLSQILDVVPGGKWVSIAAAVVAAVSVGLHKFAQAKKTQAASAAPPSVRLPPPELPAQNVNPEK